MTQLSFFKYLQTSFPTNKQSADSRKLRGGYYTPLELAHYLVKWGLRGDTTRILEPSCGDGNFILAILQHLQDSAQLRNSRSTTIVGVELKADELSKARDRAEQFGQNGVEIELVCQDFFEAYRHLQQGEKFNLIAGNPPFIRFQYFDDDSRNQAFGYLRQAGYKPTKLANAWVAFVQLSIELLQEGGRLAMVVPAELLQVKYTHELRDRLATQFEHIMLVGFKRLIFPSLTFAWAEVCGRSYGGGVLELEPREAEELPIPYNDHLEIDIAKVENLLRRDCVYEALDYVDTIVLKNYLGFDNFMIRNIRKAWEQLRDRRVERK